MAEPLSEDDCPDVRIVSATFIGPEGEKTNRNYISEDGQDFYKPLNVQIEENAEDRGNGKESKDD